MSLPNETRSTLPTDPAEIDLGTVIVDAPSPSSGPLHTEGRWEVTDAAQHAGGEQPRVIRRWQVARGWIAVTKPRIIELLLVTTIPTMVIAAAGWPDTGLLIATVLGGTLSAAGANAINNELDRDIDRVMQRTSKRPTVTHLVPEGAAQRLGIALGIAGFAVLWNWVNLTAALLSTAALLFYVFVYTIGLKRRTPQAVVIGGAAGCMPVLTAWAAVTGGSLADPRPWALFALVFWWTPPHFWALAIKYKDDYAKAGVPMLPVTHGIKETTWHILLYSWLLASVVLLSIVTLQAKLLYAVGATAATVVWLQLAHRLHRSQSTKTAMQLFIYSTTFLTGIFLLAMVDALL